MLVKGNVEKIIYRNADNGYCVVLIDGGNALGVITGVGTLPEITEGTGVELEGEFITNPKFGEQFSIAKVKVCLPTTLESIAKYLASGLFKGIGEVTADNIVDKFGVNTFDVLLNKPIELSKIRGVGASKAMEVHKAFISMQDMQDVMIYLQSLEISLNLAIKIYKKYGKATVKIVESNPYQLVEDIDGVGFYTADKIAKTMGIAVDSEFRIAAAITFILKTVAGSNGHTYLPKGKLYEDTVKLLELDMSSASERWESCITSLEVMGKIVVLNYNEDNLIMFYKSYEMEKRIASKLIALHTRAKAINIDVRADIKMYEKLHDIEFHDNQANAIINGVSSGVNVITGGPGTGKTTIIKAIIDIFSGLDLKVQLCAPTGRAAKRLQESTGVDAKTIHRLLDLDFKDGKGYFTYNENTQLECDVVIIDEVSMCDEYVFQALISAIPRGGRLVMVGDKDQLPSVGAGNVLADIISSKLIHVSCLTHIYRQSEESLIITNAHRINAGKLPILRNSNSDFLFENTQDPESIKDMVVDLVVRRIPNHFKVNPRDIQVLAPLKKGVAGATNLNLVLQQAINPPSKEKGEVKFSETVFRAGDKIIHIVNDYELNWERGDDAGQGVFNGDIGFIVAVSKEDNYLEVKFEDGRKARYTPDIYNEIMLAYAISVHKSQGSEFPITVIALSGGSYMILTRNLLYTAVTRAKNTAVIVGGLEHMQKMVANNYTAKRYTLLCEFIQEEAIRQGLYE